MYSYGPPHMAEQKQDDQHEHTFSNYVRVRDVVRKTCQRRWTIWKSGERGSGISVLPARHDDDDIYYYPIYVFVQDIYIYIYIQRKYIVSSTEKDIDMRLTKAWSAIDKLSNIWKSDLTDKMKRSFLQAAVVSILIYGCTTWTLIKRLEEKLDGNCTRMLRAISNKFWRQHPTKHQLYGYLPSRKLSVLDAPDMQDTAGEAGSNL